MTVEDPIVVFLRARLDEDEKAARWAVWDSDLRRRGLAETWELVRAGFEGRRLQIQARYGSLKPVPVVEFDNAIFDHLRAEHIVRHDPVRVLREVESKRKLIDEILVECEVGMLNPMRGIYGKTLRLLARPYSDHDDFDPAAWSID